ncbi:MAG: hypothetical protein H0T76_27555 [Nannocystis sp.]|nr:DUF5682 family protein [Nannocystis sp.]MBA3550249.1 hypothetical protein [Nannocystis sp.]
MKDLLDAAPGLDANAVEQRAREVLAEPLYWFPVRHHSPTAARYIAEVLRARRPKVIFIEGPAEATELVQHIADPKTKPPIAIYSSYRDDDNVLGLAGIASSAPDVPAKWGVWYPMLPYSPEYVAIRVAKEIGAQVVFIDLPHHGLITPHSAEDAEDEAEADEPEDELDEEDPEAEGAPAEPPTWENLAVESNFYKTLAETAGYRSWSECWDALFEVGGRHADAEEFRRDLTYFCAAVRATTSNDRMVRDGTFAREDHMWRAIATTLAEKQLRPEDAVVVCGGFHLFMKRELVPAKVLPKGTVYATVAPYSYYRTSEQSGYGAGNRAPKYYEMLYQHTQGAGSVVAEAPIRAMVDHVVAVLARGRRAGELLSSADAISITQHARMLASLRGHQAPTLDDVRDGILSCCCKGRPEEEGRYLLTAMTEVEIGSAIGRVTPALGRLPLVFDFYRSIDDLDLGETMGKEKKTKIALDLRQEADERRSVFFHRLAELGVSFAKLLEGGESNTLFREVWRVEWSPRVETELIENNLHGDTMEAAATAKIDEELAREQEDAASVCERLLRATNMDLPGLVLRIEETAGHAIDADSRLVSLARALTHLTVLRRQAARKKIREDVVVDLEGRCFARACFAIPEIANVPVEDHEEVLAALKSVAEALLGDSASTFDRDLFVENVRSAYAESTSPYLRGAMCGLLTETRAQPAEVLSQEILKFAQSRPEVMLTCGEFLDGVMATSRTAIMLGAQSLVEAFDVLLRAASWEQFLTMLPRARKAFERLHDRSRVAFADRVAQLYGLQEGEADKLAQLDTSVGAAVWMARIDARVAEVMKEWDF